LLFKVHVKTNLKYFHQISDAQKELAEMEFISSSAELALAIDKMSNAPPHVMKVVAVSGGGWHLMLDNVEMVVFCFCKYCVDKNNNI